MKIFPWVPLKVLRRLEISTLIYQPLSLTGFWFQARPPRGDLPLQPLRRDRLFRRDPALPLPGQKSPDHDEQRRVSVFLLHLVGLIT